MAKHTTSAKVCEVSHANVDWLMGRRLHDLGEISPRLQVACNNLRDFFFTKPVELAEVA